MLRLGIWTIAVFFRVSDIIRFAFHSFFVMVSVWSAWVLVLVGIARRTWAVGLAGRRCWVVYSWSGEASGVEHQGRGCGRQLPLEQGEESIIVEGERVPRGRVIVGHGQRLK